MHSTLFVLALLAADSKEDAQKKVDEAMAKSCELAKKNVENNKEACSDQAKAFEALDCASKDSRKSVDFLKVQGECLKKVKEGAKAAPASEKKAAGTHCKVTDEAGAVVLEHDSEGTTIKCQGEIREKVKAEKCEPGKKLALQYLADGGKPIAMNITCPKK